MSGFRMAMWMIDRWRKSTAYTDMRAEEQGVYRNLLDEIALRPDHTIPDDPFVLAKVSGDSEAFERSWPKVQKWMRRVAGGWTNDTQLEVLAGSKARRERQRRYEERKRVAETDKPLALALRDGKKTWLTPYGDLWIKRWGIGSVPPYGEMARALRDPDQKYGRDKLAEAFGRFLMSCSTSQFARPVRFVEGLGEWWGSGVMKTTRPGAPRRTTNEETEGRANSYLAAKRKK